MIARCFPYRRLREQHASASAALWRSLLHLLAWLLLRLESPAWQQLLAQRHNLFPHLSGSPRRVGDPLRYVVQSCWLLLVRPVQRTTRQSRRRAPRWIRSAGSMLQRLHRRILRPLETLPHSLPRTTHSTGLAAWWQRISPRKRGLLYSLTGIVAGTLALLAITAPFDYAAQLSFIALLFGLALLIRRIPGRFPILLLIILSVIVSCRYLWWRYTATLNWNNGLDLTFGIILLAAETYSWLILMLSYIQSSWPLGRRPVQLPSAPQRWPSVDLLIPTYDEDLAVVRTTVYAAMGVDWPKDKLRIYLLDDGRRQEFRAFAEEVGIGYFARPDNRHAKAGNLNYALERIDGELVAVFDADHAPVRSFLQLTVGWFLRDPKLALVQTPHHFFSPDPFERNLGIFRRRPNESELFYGLVQDGNDLWNATFFCGSCAVLRRTALDEIGGFAVETVTEDAHTALRLHRRGWNSAYLRIPQAAGLATESLAAHVQQRIRWARGMVQIFRIDNPLLGKGLSPFQRICYANAMLHFLSGLPRLIFLTAPLAFLLLQAYIIYAPALMILIHALPYMIHANLTNSRLQGRYRQTFWGEVYETTLSWYIAWPTAVALFSPQRGNFNVTAKGGRTTENQFDWKVAAPYLLLAALNLCGLGFAVWRLLYGPENEIGTVIVSSLWVIYNLLIIGSALAVAAEVRQIRARHRGLAPRLPAAVQLPGGHCHACLLIDYADGGVGLELREALPIHAGTSVTLLLRRGSREFTFSGTVRRNEGLSLGLQLDPLSHRQQIDFVQCTFGRADAWLRWNENYMPDRPLRSFADVIRLGGKGYYRLFQYTPNRLRHLPDPPRGLRWLASFLPRTPKAAPFSAAARGTT